MQRDGMLTMAAYLIPAGSVETEFEEKKSRFIATMQYVESREAAAAFFRKVRNNDPGANHHCTAFIIGDPQSPMDIGCSDDGEPAGSAGKPMLNVLYHNRIGDVAVVVTRYFGGIKLGVGGLVRAYSGGVSALMKKGDFLDHVARKSLRICFGYQYEGGVRKLLAGLDGNLVAADYDEKVTFHLELPADKADRFLHHLAELSGGSVSAEEL